MNHDKRVDFQVRRWEIDNDVHLGGVAVGHMLDGLEGRRTLPLADIDLPEHGFLLEMVDPGTVRPIRPPEPDNLVA